MQAYVETQGLRTVCHACTRAGRLAYTHLFHVLCHLQHCTRGRQPVLDARVCGCVHPVYVSCVALESLWIAQVQIVRQPVWVIGTISSESLRICELVDLQRQSIRVCVCERALD